VVVGFDERQTLSDNGLLFPILEVVHMKHILKLIALLALSIAAFSATAQDKVVYHLDSGIAQATKGLRNIRNHLDVDPKPRSLPWHMLKAWTFSWKARKPPTIKTSHPS
jgi:hypothetical protein